MSDAINLLDTRRYSNISRSIYWNLKDTNGSLDEFMRLIVISQVHIERLPSKASTALHDKYLALGKARYGSEVVDKQLAKKDFYLLQLKFEKDPSDFDVVISLAIEYWAIGQKKRSQQLLERVSTSGYPARDTAIKLLKRLNEGKTLV